MKFGFVLPYGDAKTTAELCYEAEQAGWDGFFVWEPVWGIDAWVCLTAAAMRTERIRLGTMLTPISRMRPWKLASESATLDNLSHGRVIISIGLGAIDNGFKEFGEIIDRKIRAELLDEGLDILTGLWKGQPFSHTGKHYKISPASFYPPPPPVQKPRIPIWVVGGWPKMKSMQRVVHYDGILPNVFDEKGTIRTATPKDIQAISDYIKEHRTATTPFDIVVEGKTPGNDPAKAQAIIEAWEKNGATWWIEERWNSMDHPNRTEVFRQRIQQGPPRIA